ncbi:MAG: DUF11 domain-containing protein, partial [Anaerolineae bacterium]|nr:DUF11 domain-containing protein [Anaerolineae bacterium]
EAVGGDFYTVTIRNDSATTAALNPYIEVHLPPLGFDFVGDLGLTDVASGTVPYTVTDAGATVTWTLPSTYSLAPGHQLILVFKLSTTDGTDSGQRLDVDFVYENPPGDVERLNAGENVEVGRGNLVIRKTPKVQTGTYGDVVAWDVLIANTGLGTVYSATLSDVAGIGYTDVDISELMVPAFHITVGGQHNFVVTATINSCTNLTNTALSWWSIGNEDGTGSSATPVEDVVDVAYMLDIPDISIASNDVTFDYCAQTPERVALTITNAAGAGPALNFELSSAQLGGLPFAVDNVPASWFYDGSGTFTTSQAIMPGQQVTLAFMLTPDAVVCGVETDGSFTLDSAFTDPCDFPYRGPSTVINYSYDSENSPSLSIDKNFSIDAAGTIVFTVDLDARNVESISGTIVITDDVSSFFAIDSTAATAGSIAPMGNTLVWSIPSGAGPGDLTGTMSITVTDVGNHSTCGPNDYTNVAHGYADVTCPTCDPPLSASSATVDVGPELREPDLSFEINTIQFDYCAVTQTQTIVITVTNAMTADPAYGLVLNMIQTEEEEIPDWIQPYPDSPLYPARIMVDVDQVSSEWIYSLAGERFTYIGNGGVIFPGQQITLSFVVTPSHICGNSRHWQAIFNAEYEDACGEEYIGDIDTIVPFTETNMPRFGMEKTNTAPGGAIDTGDVFNFLIDFETLNAHRMTNTIRIEDVVPGVFEILAYAGEVISSPSSVLYSITGTNVITPGGIVTSTIVTSAVGLDTRLVWEIPITPSLMPYDLTGRLTITVRVLDVSADCGAHSVYDNTAYGQAGDGCAGCTGLGAQAATTVRVLPPTGDPAEASPKSAISDGQVCGTLVVSNTYARVFISDWSSVTFTETLGSTAAPPIPAGTLNYEVGSLVVSIDGTDRTAQTAIVQAAPQLILDFDSIASPTGTHNISIIYTLYVDNDILSGNPVFTSSTTSEFEVLNVASQGSCGSGDNYNFEQTASISIQRADLQIDISPDNFVGCAPTWVTLTVSDPDLVSNNLVANNIVVTLNIASPEFEGIDLSAVSYGGGFTGNPVTVISADNTITWTFANPLTATNSTTGTIGFTMTRSCNPANLRAGVRFENRCVVVYSHTDNNNEVVESPEIRLFVTPDHYNIAENRVYWHVYAFNTGDGIAGQFVITNLLGTGLALYTYTTTLADQVDLLTSAPFTGGKDVVWQVSNLAPGQVVHMVITATTVSCADTTSVVQVDSGCLDGSACPGFYQDEVIFGQLPVAVRSENDQTADLPLCETGVVILRVKNAALESHIYNMVVTETITSMGYVAGTAAITIEDRFGNPIPALSNIPFEPRLTVSSSLTTTMLYWGVDIALFPTQTNLLQDRGPEETIVIEYMVQTDCETPGENRVQATAGGDKACGDFFLRLESAETLDTIEPDITLTKDGLNSTQGDTAYANTVYGGPGDVIVWRVTAENAIGAYVAQNVVVSDVLSADLAYSSTLVTMGTVGYVVPTRAVSWTIGNLPADGIDHYMYITNVLTTGIDCRINTTNTAELSYGCDDGCRVEPPERALAYIVKQPELGLVVPGSTNMNVCGGDLTIIIENENGPDAYNVVLTDTLPMGYEYVFGVAPGSVISPATGATVLTWTWNILPQGTTVITFSIRQTATDGICAIAPTGSNVVHISYEDHPGCLVPITHTEITTSTINFDQPDIQISKLPDFQVDAVGEVVTWTVTVTNTGTGEARWVVVTDTAGSQFLSLTHLGNTSSATANLSGTNVITWDLGTLPTGATWVVTLTAVLTESGHNENLAEVSSHCGTGCQTVDADNDAFVSLLNDFAKTPEVQTGTIGSLVVFEIEAALSDANGAYEGIVVTDALPVGLGYVSAVLTYVVDVDGADGGPTQTVVVPSNTPGLYDSGNIVWALGVSEPGVVQINGTITAVIQAIDSNQHGISRTNEISMTYVQDGYSYNFTDTADIKLVEPLLHIGKSYVTESGCEALLHQANFNVSPDGWTTSASIVRDATQGVLHFTGSDTSTNNQVDDASDFSLSFMAKHNADNNGRLNVDFRMQDGNNRYMFWIYPDGNLSLIRRAGGSNNTLDSATLPRPLAWHHYEIRAEGPHLRIYVDGQLALEATNDTFGRGSIEFRGSNNIDMVLDDVLVTRLNQTGCFVGANDLVTYTLVVSNHTQAIGYDLVITDVLPAGMTLRDYTLTSDDPLTLVITEPSPIPGATGVLTWGINQLVPGSPYVPTTHNALTLTVVLSVVDHITANIVLANQASLIYDNWSGNSQPTTITRDYGGGSHSTAVRTVDGGIRKREQFSPPSTATLGTLVTYTLIVPAQPISAT